MWQLPTVERSGGGRLFPLRPPRGLVERELLCELRHTITNHRIRVAVKRAELRSPRTPPGTAWVDADRIDELALTGMTRKCLSAILAEARA